MPLLDHAYLEKLAAYFASGDLEQDFEFAEEEGRMNMLDFLEQLMDLAETADTLATKLIFKNSALADMFDANQQE